MIELADFWRFRLPLVYFWNIRLREAGTVGLADFWNVRLRYPRTVELANIWSVRLMHPDTFGWLITRKSGLDILAGLSLLISETLG